jgi:hypothetical protein
LEWSVASLKSRLDRRMISGFLAKQRIGLGVCNPR